MAALNGIAADPRIDLAAEWQAPSVANGQVWRAWLNAGSQGLPPSLVLAIPVAFRTGSLGLPALLWLARQVMTSSDQSLGIEHAYFNSPDPVSKPWMLGIALIEWKKCRQSLIAGGLAPSEIACRLSLLHLWSAPIGLWVIV